jgi:hypothetical protein
MKSDVPEIVFWLDFPLIFSKKRGGSFWRSSRFGRTA